MTLPVSPRQVFWSVLVGVLLVQGAWILTLPTFRGSDEFDHVYRAAAVARGEWTSHGGAVNGRGGYVDIPGSIVKAAQEVCEVYDYTGPDNCRASRTYPNGDVQVATAASQYNPTYYAVIGTLAKPFGGDAANYAMRILGALLCAVLIAWAAALTARWAQSWTPLIALAVGLTPVLIYSTTVAAPNGLTYAGAVLFWSALIAASRSDAATGWRLALPAAVGASVMVTTHTTGAMWVFLISIIALVLRPFREWVGMLARDRAPWAIAILAVSTVTALSLVWVRANNTNALSAPMEDVPPLTGALLFRSELLWIFQTIAAFPVRNEAAPTLVYVLWAVPFAVLAVRGTRAASSRLRLTLVSTLVLVVAVPTVLTLLTYTREGVSWQGRYTLPLSIGLVLLAGSALDRWGRPLPTRAVVAGFLLMAAAMAISTVHVGLHEVARNRPEPAAAAFPGGFVLVGVLTVSGMLLPLLLLARSRASRPASTHRVEA